MHAEIVQNAEPNRAQIAGPIGHQAALATLKHVAPRLDSRHQHVVLIGFRRAHGRRKEIVLKADYVLGLPASSASTRLQST